MVELPRLRAWRSVAARPALEIANELHHTIAQGNTRGLAYRTWQTTAAEEALEASPYKETSDSGEEAVSGQYRSMTDWQT